MSDLDPRWQWVDVTALGDMAPRYIKARCRHLEVVPVELASAFDEVVAYLCVTCDQQLPAEWKP